MVKECVGVKNNNMTELEEKKKELKDLKKYHKSAWDTYGSELCAGGMIAKEESLEKEIELLEDNGENLGVV